MLRVTLIGNLGRDPETRYSQKGTLTVTFSVAVNQVRTSQDGEREESTEWFRIRSSGRLAEFAQKLGKGSRVLVLGRLDISHYQGKDGEPRTGFDVWADEIQSMRVGEAVSRDGTAALTSAPASAGAEEDAANLEDLPF